MGRGRRDIISIQAKKERHNKFYNLDPEVKRLYHIHIAEHERPRPLLWRENFQERIDYAVSMYESAVSRIDWLNDDFIPFATCVTGTEIFAEALGSKVIKPVNDMPFALPFITKPSEIANIKAPALEDSSLFYLFDMADKIKAACGGDALLGLIDVQTPMDIAALIWDKNYFFIAMLEEPEAVKELAHKISGLYYAFFDEWFKRYGNEFIAHYPDYYMPSGFTFSEDEVGAVSPEIFEQLFLPELIEMSDRYGILGMHCCANAEHQWENFKKIPNLKMLNLVQPYQTMVKSSAFFAGHSAQYPGWGGTGEQDTWFSQLDSNAHVCLDFWVQNDDEAKRLADKLALSN